MKPIRLVLFLISLNILACSESNTKDSNKVNDDRKTKINLKSDIVFLNQNIDFSSVVLTIERGAFHYDKFILKDTLITFYPSSESLTGGNDNYTQISEQIISKQTRNKFVRKIIEDGFFKLKNSYSSNRSCNSNLTVTFKLNDQSRKIVSEDFETECPELLIYIEQEIIRMHNKNLKRISLPG